MSRKQSGLQIVHDIRRDQLDGTLATLTLEVTKAFIDGWEKEEGVDLEALETITPAVAHRLDQFIIRWAERVGAPLLYVPVVIVRMRDWREQSNGSSLMKDLGNALAKSVLIFQGEVLPPIDDPRLPEFKKQVVAELRTIQPMLKTFRAKPRKREEVLSEFERLVKVNGGRLLSNLASFMKFFRKTNASLDRAPAAFFDQCYGWCPSHDPETVRTEISRLGNIKSR